MVASNQVHGSDDHVEIADELLSEWIKLASNGNREAQRQIYERLAPRLYRVLRRIVGESDAEDVTQGAFMHLFAKLKQYRFESSLETWGHRLAVNHALQFLRRKHRKQDLEREYAESLTSTKDVSEQKDGTEQHEWIVAAMDRLDPELRAILQLKEFEGFSYRKIAEILDVPEGTVGSRLNKARRDLRQELEAIGWTN